MDLNAILSQGFELLKQGELERCARLCQSIPVGYRNKSGVLFLQARLLERQNQPIEARKIMERLVAASPANPQFQLSLGRVLKAEGSPDSAEDHIRQALRLEPNLAEAQYLLGRLLLSSAREEEAVVIAQQLVQGVPSFAEGWELLAAAQQRGGHLGAALDTCRKGCEQCPRHPRLRYALGQLLRENCDFELAVSAYQEAEQLGLKIPELYQNCAEALGDSGNQSKALAVISRGLALHPQNALLHRLCARLHFEAKANGDPVQKIWESALADKTNTELWQTLIELLDRLGRANDVEAALDEIPTTAEDSSPGLCILRAKHLSQSGRMDEALERFEAVLRRYPDDSNVLLSFAMALLEAGDVERAIKMCDSILSRNPYDQLALAYLGVGLRLMRDSREAWLFDYERMISVLEVPVPAGYDGRRQFFTALSETLTRMHHAKSHPLEQTVRGGTQTNGFLFRHPDPILAQLEKQLKTVIADTVSRFPEIPKHPFWRTPRAQVTPEDIRFSGAWSVRLMAQGFHTNHVHPTGWLSAVLYVALPTLVSDETGAGGCIQFGEPLRELWLDLPPKRLIRPEVGTLVLFPSYMWHGTIPFDSDESRITVAFDVLPIG